MKKGISSKITRKHYEEMERLKKEEEDKVRKAQMDELKRKKEEKKSMSPYKEKHAAVELQR